MKKSVAFMVLLFLFGLSVVSAEVVSNSTTYLYTSNLFVCVRSASSSYWRNDNGTIEMIYNDTYTGGNATKYSSDSFCCPTNYLMDSSSRCVFNQTDICAYIKDASTCNSAPSMMATKQIEAFPNSAGICNKNSDGYLNSSSSLCVNYTGCSCVWNDSSKKCTAERKFEVMCDGLNNSLRTCSWTETSQIVDCEKTGKITIIFSASGTSKGIDSWCVDQTQEYACASSVKLPFFSFVSFIISVFAIALIYVLFSKEFKKK